MKRLLAALILIAGSSALRAQAAATLSLDDCLKLAGEKHPVLAAAQAGVSAASEAVGEARAPYYPNLDLNAGYHRWQRRAFLRRASSSPAASCPTSSVRSTTGTAGSPRA